jgi:hypothetical protein
VNTGRAAREGALIETGCAGFLPAPRSTALACTGPSAHQHAAVIAKSSVSSGAEHGSVAVPAARSQCLLSSGRLTVSCSPLQGITPETKEMEKKGADFKNGIRCGWPQRCTACPQVRWNPDGPRVLPSYRTLFTGRSMSIFNNDMSQVGRPRAFC